MTSKVLISAPRIEVMLTRLCHQLLENHEDLTETVILGLQPRGTLLAKRIGAKLSEISGQAVAIGWIDVTFHRDDFRRRDTPLQPNATHVPYVIEGKRVVLIDDVLFTGRTVRSALDAMIAYGRPRKVELLVLIDRYYARELPIEASYIGTSINSSFNERVQVNWAGENDATQDEVWLLSLDAPTLSS